MRERCDDAAKLDIHAAARDAGSRLSNRYGLEIRAATSGDVPGLVELMAASGVSIAPYALAARLEALQGDSGAVLVALEWGPPSGLIAVHWHPTLETDRPVAEVTTLLVAPDDRRRGIGRLLLKAAARSARLAGCEKLRLCANPDQIGLRQFCAANGFEAGPTCLVRPLRKRGHYADE